MSAQRAPSPSPRPARQAPPRPALRTRRPRGPGEERASERRRDPAGGWGFRGARFHSLPSGSRDRRPAPPPGKMALHFQVSALCAAGPRFAVPGTRWDAGIWRLRAEDGGGGRGAADERPGDSGTGLGCTPRARARGRGTRSWAAGGGAEARLEARPSWEVRMLRTGAKGGFGGSQAGGSSTRSHQPSRRVARRGSVISPHTVGTELERGPGSAEAAAVAVGL